VVYFPADGSGATTASQISTVLPNYPIVVAVHGNSSFTNSYQGYNYLLEHWAKNGFIAASIHLNPGMQGTGRGPRPVRPPECVENEVRRQSPTISGSWDTAGAARQS